MAATGSASLPARAEAVLARLPVGTVNLAIGYLEAATARLAGLDDGSPVDVDPDKVMNHLITPLLLSDDWPDPTDPLPVGDGAVHADLIEDDLEVLARLRSTLEGRPEPETLAVEAQSWRLPVTPYRLPPPPRSRPTSSVPPPAKTTTGPTQPREAPHKRLSDYLVVDLTALWAGPLATKLLADQGVTIVKVDPACRPDGFGEHPRLYQHLNADKDVVDLDLREPGHRSRFESLLAKSDLLIDSFSRRVLPNLGYDHDELRRINPMLATLSIVAFPAGSPEADWLSYGPGVHATSGLAADTSTGRTRYRAAPIAYPDALAGMQAFGIAIDALVSAGGHYEISLANSIAPLLRPGDADATVVG